MSIETAQNIIKCRRICIKVVDIVVELDECQICSVHIDIACQKLSKKKSILGRLQIFMSNAALLKICNTVIFPHFDYCCTVWCSGKKCFINGLSNCPSYLKLWIVCQISLSIFAILQSKQVIYVHMHIFSFFSSDIIYIFMNACIFYFMLSIVSTSFIDLSVNIFFSGQQYSHINLLSNPV